MLVALEVYFDTDADERIRSLSHQLNTQSRPHISLIVGSEQLLDMRGVIASAMSDVDMSMTFDCVGTFPHGLLYLGFEETPPQLQALQQHAYETAIANNVTVIDHCIPSQWTPHCTIARKLSNDRIDYAMKTIPKLLPIDASIQAIGLTRVGTGQTEVIG